MHEETSHRELIRYPYARLHLQMILWQVSGRPGICIACQSQDDLSVGSAGELPFSKCYLAWCAQRVLAQAYHLTIPGLWAPEENSVVAQFSGKRMNSSSCLMSGCECQKGP